MIKFFLKVGDVETDVSFTPYLWGSNGLGRFIDVYVNSTDYGAGLHLLLIKLYVEGLFEVHGPDSIQIGNLSKIRQETSAAFTIRRSDFLDVSETERKRFLVEMVIKATDLVILKHGKKISAFNFKLLKSNLLIATEYYLNSPL